MKKLSMIKAMLVGAFFLYSYNVYSSAPVWTFTPLTPTTMTVNPGEDAVIAYLVTNQSHKNHTLTLKPIPGLHQVTAPGSCSKLFTLGYGQSCVLTMVISGNSLQQNITSGPVVCQQSNNLQCYQPNLENSLHISKGTLSSYTVGGSIIGLLGHVVLQNNGSDNLNLNENGSFVFSTPVAEGTPYHVTVLTQPINQTCIVTNGRGIMGSANVTNVDVICTDNSTLLTANVSNLALSINAPTTNAALTGNPRLITVTNTGGIAADGLTINYPTFPTGTTAFSTCSSTLASGNSCTIIITPGSAATSNCTTGITPIPGVITISANNSNALTPNVFVLGYGCIYQGGYLFSVDDTTPNTQSITGKVLALEDQTLSSLVWGSNGSGSAITDVSYDLIPGIALTSTTSAAAPTYNQFETYFNTIYTISPTETPPSVFESCNGRTDGTCNSNNIRNFYNAYITNYDANTSPPYTPTLGATQTSYYAAGTCIGTINGYNDWYLPAICEMGYDGNAVGNGCGSVGSPLLIQNIQTNLVNSLIVTNFNFSFYWSSTEDLVPTEEAMHAWYQTFIPNTSQQGNADKNSTGSLGSRCTRALTN